MLEHVRTSIRRSFPTLKNAMDFRLQNDVYDTVQTMNISQSLNFSLILLVMEGLNLSFYLYADFRGRLITPLSMAIISFLLILAGNIFYCEHLLKLERTEETRFILKHHTYFFTIAFSFFCLTVNYICLKNRMTAESVVIFYIYIAAGPIYSLPETLSAVLLTTLCSIPAFLYQNAPPLVYATLFLYCFISIFLSQMRCRIIKIHLFQLREAWDEQVTLQNRADNDPLTQILNRNGYSLRLEDLLPYTMRLQIPVAVIMVDIDYFKQYNDTFGHIAGDECLKKIAYTLSSNIHQGKDLICRFGGEEFQMFLYGIKSSDAIKAAERLRQAVARLKIPAADQSASPYVTISLGVACTVLSSMEDYHNLVKAADHELYYSKNHGKNMLSFRELDIPRSFGLSFEDKLENARLIYENSASPFAVIKVTENACGKQDFCYIYINDACARLECISRHEIYSRSFLGHYPGAGGHRISSYHKIALNGGRETIYDFRPEISKYLKIECFQFHEGCCGCILEDVTDQHYFELFGNNGLSILSQITDGGILITGYDAALPSVVYMNTRLLKALDYSSFSEYRRQKSPDFSFLEDIYPDDIPSFRESLSMFTRDDSVNNCIIRIRKKKGQPLWFMLRGKLIIDEHQTPLVLFTAYHITKQLGRIQFDSI
ncbi:MAG: diguanylate cyclase [Clostridium sp.]|nr:diguanylate cyclase [Clostridium sp.]